MGTRFESKIGRVKNSDERLFNFLSDFRNFESLIPPDKVKNFKASQEECSFEIEYLGATGLKIIEKEPFKLIKITGNEVENKKFFLWIQIKQVSPEDSMVKVTMEAELNPFMKMMAAKPIQSFIDTLVNQVEKLTHV